MVFVLTTVWVKPNFPTGYPGWDGELKRLQSFFLLSLTDPTDRNSQPGPQPGGLNPSLLHSRGPEGGKPLEFQPTGGTPASESHPSWYLGL
jgi:hypothetical protein